VADNITQTARPDQLDGTA